MTTIVCTRTEMASDSRAADDDTACQVPKIFRIRKGLLGIAGALPDCMAFVSWFRGGCKPQAVPNMEHVQALYLTQDGKIVCFDSAPHSYEIREPFAAIGSGAAPALGALHAGASPKEAIRAASKVDCGTGGLIRVRAIGKL